MTETREQRMVSACRSANVIDDNGLHQGDLYDPWPSDNGKCAVCAVGALRQVITGRPDGEPGDMELFDDFLDRFSGFLGGDSVPDWSDGQGRTAEDVKEAFRRFGDSLLTL